MNNRKRLYTMLFIGVVASILIWIAIFSIDTYIRTINAVFYLLHSIAFVFSFGLIDAPLIPEFAGGLIQGSSSVILFPLDLKELVYQFRAFSIALINYEVMLGYLVVVLRITVNIFQFAAYLPLIILMTYLLARLSLLSSDQDDGQETKALSRFKAIEKRILTRITAEFIKAKEFYFDKKQRWIHIITIVLILFVTKLLPGILELASWVFFTNIAKPDIFTFISIVTVLFFDILALLIFVGQGPTFIMGILLFQLLRHIDGKDYLKKCDDFNMNLAEGIGVGTLIKGPPGVGKTTMATLLQIYSEKIIRFGAFDIMKKYEKMFMKYNWRELDRYIDFGYINRKFVNRAQIRKCIDDAFASPENEVLFGYDVNHYPIVYFDGNKPINLKQAISTYAEAYSLYSTPKPLAACNYSTRYSNILNKGFFPLWDYDVLNRNNRKLFDFSSYATPINYDARRIYQMADSKSKEWVFMLDGQVEVMTEAAGERGNNKDYEGMTKDDFQANQKNDGFNMSIRVTRHWFTIDGKCFNRLIFDSQREVGINADLRETLEDKIQIVRRNEMAINFPFLFLEESMIVPLLELWDKYYAKYKNKRYKHTLPIYLINNYIVKPINDYYSRIVEAYSYGELLYKHEAGGSDEEEGLINNARFYIISKLAYPYTFATDAYRDFLDSPKLAATKGFRDAPTFGGYRMSKDEALNTKGYFPTKLSQYEKATKIATADKPKK